MRLVVLGQGAETELWKETARRHPNVSLVASLSTSGSEAELASALESAQADAVMVCGALPSSGIVGRIQSGVNVIVTDPGELSESQGADLQSGVGQRLFWVHGYRYSRCESTVRRLLRSVGVIGHISCHDARSLEEPVSPASQWFRHGVGHVESVARLLTTDTRSVMARLSLDGDCSATEAFVTLGNGSRVQYYGLGKASQPAHSLWIEGSGGSLRTDGRTVWWRKRGWRFFAPVGFSLAKPGIGQQQVLGELLAGLESGTHGDSRNSRSAGLALAGWESNQTGTSVASSQGAG